MNDPASRVYCACSDKALPERERERTIRLIGDEALPERERERTIRLIGDQALPEREREREGSG
jgi:hypothetical protein